MKLVVEIRMAESGTLGQVETIDTDVDLPPGTFRTVGMPVRFERGFYLILRNLDEPARPSPVRPSE